MTRMTVGDLREALANVPAHWHVDAHDYSERDFGVYDIEIPEPLESDDPYDDEWEAGRIPAVTLVGW